MTWLDHAACRDADPTIFFPGRGESVAQAKAICACCPVRHECLVDAARHWDDWGRYGGIRGGTSTLDRRSIDRTQLLKDTHHA